MASRIRRLGRWVRNNPSKTLTAIGTSATIGAVEEGWLHRLYDVALQVVDNRFTGHVPLWPEEGYSLHKAIEFLGKKIVIPIGTMGQQVVPNPKNMPRILGISVDPVDVAIYDVLMGTPANVYLIGLGVAIGICGLSYGIYRFGTRVNNWYRGKNEI